jgi:hypothetical protein
MVQIILCGLIVLIAALYVAHQWLPQQWKQRLFGKTVRKAPGRACSACSSCADCEGINAAQKIIITRHK